MKTNSQEYRDLMKKWSDESFIEEVERDYEEYKERQDSR
ncbi:hypothetical protein LCGC14_0561050 [marine sediment metagenome]|uniref:Uncharacterized protein n=1 Tax=marine sediment metagenome TaxID=412755 RepID=A0A0F9RS55_9ZZZZ